MWHVMFGMISGFQNKVNFAISRKVSASELTGHLSARTRTANYNGSQEKNRLKEAQMNSYLTKLQSFSK